MPESRDDWAAAMQDADVLYPPLEPPAACPRCLRPMREDERRWGTCYQCGREHPPTLARITVVTYGADATRPWQFYKTAKFGQTTSKKLATFINGIAAMISQTIETKYPDFVDGDNDHVIVPLPSTSGLIARCISAIAANGWGRLHVVDALTAENRPRQTGLDMNDRRAAAAGKYAASPAVAGKHVLLLDDAYTSGYSIHDAARAVDEAGALSVSCVIYARRIYPEAMAVYRAERGEEGDGSEG
jgi:predicted amidophosphoribosyltransferase